jgi:hypothetical protein
MFIKLATQGGFLIELHVVVEVGCQKSWRSLDVLRGTAPDIEIVSIFVKLDDESFHTCESSSNNNVIVAFKIVVITTMIIKRRRMMMLVVAAIAISGGIFCCIMACRKSLHKFCDY